MAEDIRRVPVYEDGRLCGTAELTRDGLYWRVRCVCRPSAAGVVRLYATGTGEKFCCGVPEPGPDGLALSRRFAASGFPAERIEKITVGESGTDWTPWAGTILGRRVENGLTALAAGERLAALPLGKDGSFPWMGLFCLTAPRRIGGAWYLTLPLSKADSCARTGDGV